MKKHEKLARQILKDHPEQGEVHITEDGQPFFSGIKARNYAGKNRHDKKPTIFFSSGNEPEDNSDLEAAIEKLKSRNATLEATLEATSNAADLGEDVPELNTESAAEVVAVVELREKIAEAEKHSGQMEEALKSSQEAQKNAEKELKDLQAANAKSKSKK